MKNEKIHTKSLVKNAFVNVIGQNFPIIVAFFIIPVLIKNLGNERFGLLTIVWMIIGYCSLFDFGLGRALTKVVAEKLGNNDQDNLTAIIWSSLALMFIIGMIVAISLLISSSYLTIHFLSIPVNLQQETALSICIMSISIPVVITTAGLVGVLQAYHRFDILNAIRIPMGALSYIGPCLGLYFSNSLVTVVAITAVLRIINWLLHLWFCSRIVSDFKRIKIKPSELVPLLRIGGWMTVSNTISPLMLYFDRILLSGMVSVGAIAYYTTPYEMITKFLQIPLAITNVLFPAFSRTHSTDMKQTSLLYWNSLKSIFLIAFPVLATVVAFSFEGISLWINPIFAQKSYIVMQLLAMGVFLNALAFVPATLLQGIGRPDLNAKLHLLEFPMYLLLLFVLVGKLGYVGAALAWLIRVGFDFVLLFFLSTRLLDTNKTMIVNSITMVVLGVIIMCLLSTDVHTAKYIIYLLSMIGFASYLWKEITALEGKSIFTKIKGLVS